MTNAKQIEKFVLSEIAADLGKQSLGPDEDLLEERIIDSLGLLKLVTFIEEACNIKVNDEDIVPENFQTLNNIVKFIERKKAAKPQEPEPSSSLRIQSEKTTHAANKSPGFIALSSGIQSMMGPQ